MCACCGEVLHGRLPGPFTSAMAEEWTRRALIPDTALADLGGATDADAASALNVPLDQFQLVRHRFATAPRREPIDRPTRECP
jgi:hypothetical protein